jgi:hypothetical protein
MKTFLAVLTVACLFCDLDAQAVDKIGTAFGMNLGDSFDPASAVRNAGEIDGLPRYAVSVTNCPECSTNFNYLVQATPAGKKIFSISAFQIVTNMDTAEKAQDALMEQLQAKYGPADAPQKIDKSSDGFTDLTIIKSITQGDRSIKITAQALFTMVSLEVTYADDSLKNLAGRELLREEIKGSGKIEGAFGKKLGDVFDISTATNTATTVSGATMYEFAPTEAIRSFREYYVLITPKTKKIHTIIAMRMMDQAAAAKNEQSLLMSIFAEKYGPPAAADKNAIMQDNRGIMVNVSDDDKPTVSVYFMDTELSNQAKAEKEETPVVTMANYTQIVNGMSYQQVKDIVGTEGKEMSSSELAGFITISYSWQNSDGSNMLLIFQNDKLVTKSQFGLP